MVAIIARGISKFTPELEQLFNAMAGAGVGGEGPKILDADALIDEIIAKKGPHQYKGGLSEDNWEQELEQIPLFMTKSPDQVDVEASPGLAALQSLKYELSTPEGRATASKEEGNELFRRKCYQQAVHEYTAGLKEEGVGVALRAILYTNRAAANSHMGNLRSCLNDVCEARKIKPDHFKALQRGAMTCMKLECYGEALEWCDQGLGVSPEDSALRNLRSKVVTEKKRQERDQRKMATRAKAKKEDRLKLLDAIKSRGVDLARTIPLDDEKGGNRPSSPQLVLEGAHPTGEVVHFDPEGRLIWPVLFLYPEHGQTDFISCFMEEQRFSDHFEVMFGEADHPMWDQERRYWPDTLQVYYEDSITGGLVHVEANKTLKETLSRKGYTVAAGTPSFFVLSRDSAFTQHFLQQTK